MADLGAAQLPLSVPSGLDASAMVTEFSTVAYQEALMPEVEVIESAPIIEFGQLYPN